MEIANVEVKLCKSCRKLRPLSHFIRDWIEFKTCQSCLKYSNESNVKVREREYWKYFEAYITDWNFKWMTWTIIWYASNNSFKVKLKLLTKTAMETVNEVLFEHIKATKEIIDWYKTYAMNMWFCEKLKTIEIDE